jgi:hypothetical protein
LVFAERIDLILEENAHIQERGSKLITVTVTDQTADRTVSLTESVSFHQELAPSTVRSRS